MSSHQWGENTRADLAQRTDSTVIVPVGSTEQHGDHLPVDTDTSIPAAIATAVAEERDGILVTPAVPFGYSRHHAGAPGTITLRSQTFMLVIRDILASLYQAGFKEVLVLNGHGGNRAPLTTATTDAYIEEEIAVAVVSYWDLIAEEIDAVRDSEQGGISHAGELETSVQLYLREELVGETRADFVRNDRDGYLRVDLFGHGQASYPRHFDEKTATGVSGMPSAATTEKGEKLFTAAVDAVAAFVESFQTWKKNEPL